MGATSLAKAIKNADQNAITTYLYSPDDPSQSDEDLFNSGKVRITYNGTKYIYDPASITNYRIQANLARQNAICDYIKNHATVIYSYTGTIGPDPDPVTAFTCKVTAFTSMLKPITQATPSTGINTAYASAIKSYLNSGMVVNTEGFVCASGTDTLSNLVLPMFDFSLSHGSDNAYDLTVNEIANKICLAFQTAPPKVVPYTHGAGSGAATRTSIILS